MGKILKDFIGSFKLTADERKLFDRYVTKNNLIRMFIPMVIFLIICIINFAFAQGSREATGQLRMIVITWCIFLTCIVFLILVTLALRGAIKSQRARKAIIGTYWTLFVAEMVFFSLQEVQETGTAYNFIFVLVIVAVVPLLKLWQIAVLTVGGAAFLGVFVMEYWGLSYLMQTILGTAGLAIVISQLIYLPMRNSVLLREKLLEQNERDGLTGLYNRWGMERMVPSLFAECIDKKKTFGTMMIDIDHFKKINDTYGHLQADEFLKRVCSYIMEETEKSGGIAIRYGGEEMLCVFEGLSEFEFKKKAITIKETIATLPMPIDTGKDVFITVSIGIEQAIPTDAQNYLEIIKNADDALYTAKQSGRDRVAMHGKTVTA